MAVFQSSVLHLSWLWHGPDTRLPPTDTMACPLMLFALKKTLSFNVSLHSETPRRYAYLRIFSYKDPWNWNRNTAVFCRATRNWEAFEKLGFEVLTSSLQGLPQLCFLHVLMAWTAGVFRNRFQGASLLLCIADYFYFLFFWGQAQHSTFLFVHEITNYPSFKFTNIIWNLLKKNLWYSQLIVPQKVLSSQTKLINKWTDPKGK